MQLTVDGRAVDLDDTGGTLLDALRDQVGVTSVKDGCSPQGQCGCCTVLVDGRPRVACVTPLRRVAGRSVTTVEGLEPERREALVAAFVACGASQCGFCTPGIICRLAAVPGGAGRAAVESALLAHLCRCTGWRSIVDAGVLATSTPASVPALGAPDGGARRASAEQRAAIEGGVPQHVGPEVVTGHGGFSADTAPADALVAVPDGHGDWVVAPTLAAARAAAGKVQGRRSGQPIHPPLSVPPGEWALTLATTWVEPGYLEPDAAWCEPGGEPSSPVANGGAFGGKAGSPLPEVARRLADRHGAPVLAVWSREDVVRNGPKRPPLAVGVRADGTGVLRAVRTPGLAEAVGAVAPGLVVEEVDLPGPPTSVALRGAGWVEAAVVLAGLRSLTSCSGSSSSSGQAPFGVRDEERSGRASVVDPRSGGRATATVRVDADGRPLSVAVTVDAGDPLDEVVLRSYVAGAAHMALGWVCSEGIAVGDDGIPDDLTVRSWGVLRARDMPPLEVEPASSEDIGAPPVRGSDAAFAAVAAACWIAQGLPPSWPTMRGAF